MADAVKITNRTRQVQTISLDHEIFCRFSNACGCSRGITRVRIRPLNGAPQGLKEHKRRHPAVVTLMPGATSSPLHPAAIRLPQVVTGKANGTFQVERGDFALELVETPPETPPETVDAPSA